MRETSYTVYLKKKKLDKIYETMTLSSQAKKNAET